MADDPVMLIAGASSGIGAWTARRDAEAGYRYALREPRGVDINEIVIRPSTQPI